MTHSELRLPRGIDPARGAAWRRYMESRASLRLGWPSMDIGIFDISLLRRRDNGEVVRVLVWPERWSRLLIPEAVDALILRADPPRPGSPNSGVVPRDAALAALADHTRRYEEPVPYWLYRATEDHALLFRRVAGLAVEPARALTSIRDDEFEDAP